MENSNLLPSTVVLALLRLVRGVDGHPEDEDVLLDEFGALGRDSVIPKAIHGLLGDRLADHSIQARSQIKALDALLVDMLREHWNRRPKGEPSEERHPLAVEADQSRRLELAARRVTEQIVRPGSHNRVRAERAA